MATPQLAIGRLSLALECSPGPGERLAREAARWLGSELSGRLAGRLPDSDRDGPMLLIRRLQVEITHSTADPLDSLADRLAEAITAGVARAEATKAGGLFFASRAAYAAAFLEALLDGSAWRRWWFGGFSSLRPLPVSAAVRTLLSRDWASAPAILAACPPPLRARLWAVLTPQDAGLILTGLTSGGAGAPTPAAWIAAARALLESEGLPDPVAALAVVAEVAAVQEAGDLGWLVPIAERAASLGSLLRGGPAEPGAVTASGLPRNESQTPPLPTPLIEAIRKVRGDAAAPAAPSPGRWRTSGLLGFALLLPALHELPIDEAVRNWEVPAPALSAADLVRLLVLSACAGADSRLWSDPVWRDLHGLPGPFCAGEIAAWARRVPPAAWRALREPVAGIESPPLALPRTLISGHATRAALGSIAARLLLLNLAQRLPGFAEASAGFLRDNLLCAGGSALIGQEEVRIRLERPPLDILLGMSGLAEREARLADGRRLILERRP